MLHFYDPNTESTLQRIETLRPGFVADLVKALEERKLNCSLREQQIDKSVAVSADHKTQAFINVTETRSNGKKKEVCLQMYCTGNAGWAHGRWCFKAEIIV